MDIDPSGPINNYYPVTGGLGNQDDIVAAADQTAE